MVPSSPSGVPGQRAGASTRRSSFPPTRTRTRPRPPEAEAKRLCASCPALAPCRDYALSAPEPYGTWGGMSETERRRYARQQRSAASMQ
ncbi:WhiB family transcriptional regulator [Rhodococcus jostii]|uniref:WhiB family transcriptional regulator n=1 Tax=Rhodococcus jostii TaxID=132919 RepID=UPI003646CF97